MKKILFFVIAVSAFFFTSCKKDRSCMCFVSTSESGSTTATYSYTYEYDDSYQWEVDRACVSSIKQDGHHTITKTCSLR